MKANAFADLEAAIQRWMDHWCETADWPDVIIGDQTVTQMAMAARMVFEACEESQAYAKREGYMKVGA